MAKCEESLDDNSIGKKEDTITIQKGEAESSGAKDIKSIDDIKNINSVTKPKHIKNLIEYLKYKGGKVNHKTYKDSKDLLDIDDIKNINNITNKDEIKKIIEHLISQESGYMGQCSYIKDEAAKAKCESAL